LITEDKELIEGRLVQEQASNAMQERLVQEGVSNTILANI